MRRHRLNEEEVNPVKLACLSRLLTMVEERDPDELLNASILFRVWFRFESHCVGKPSYPRHDSYTAIEKAIWIHKPQEASP